MVSTHELGSGKTGAIRVTLRVLGDNVASAIKGKASCIQIRHILWAREIVQ